VFLANLNETFQFPAKIEKKQTKILANNSLLPFHTRFRPTNIVYVIICGKTSHPTTKLHFVCGLVIYTVGPYVYLLNNVLVTAVFRRL